MSIMRSIAAKISEVVGAHRARARHRREWRTNVEQRAARARRWSVR
jgi:hypothetical protein